MVSLKFWTQVRGFLFASLILACGCSSLLDKGGSAFPSSFAEFVRGDLYSTEEVGIKQAKKAVPEGLKDLGYRVTQEEVEKESAYYVAEGTGERLIRIWLKKESGTTTEFRIRVGLDGDEPLSRFVLAKVKTRL
jgi:hypothetical protein